MPRTRTWIAWTVGCLLLLLAAAVLLAPRLLDERRLRAEAERRIGAALGRPVTIRGPLSVETGVSTRVDARDVTIGGGADAPALLVVERVRASVDTASLVTGALQLGEVRLDRPRVHLHVDRAGRGNWEGLGGSGPDAAPSTPGWSLEALAIDRGELRYSDARNGSDYTLADWQLQTGRVALPDPFDLTTSFAARSRDAALGNARVSARVSADPPTQRYALDTLRADGEWSRPAGAVPVRLAIARFEYAGAEGTAAVRGLEARLLGIEVRADGSATQLATEPAFDARLATAVFEPRAVLRALQMEVPSMAGPDALASAEFASGVAYAQGTARLTGVAARLDDTRVTGAAALTAGDSMAWVFDLAADRIVADRYLKPPQRRDTSPVVLPLEFLRGLDARGTLRVGELVAAGVRLRDVTIDLGAVARGESP